MKTILKLSLIGLLLLSFSCRDTKQEEAETKVAVEQIEAIEKETDEIMESVDENAKKLEEELKELDNL